MKSRRLVVPLLISALLPLAGCGGTSGGSADPDATAAKVMVALRGAGVTNLKLQKHHSSSAATGGADAHIDAQISGDVAGGGANTVGGRIAVFVMDDPASATQASHLLLDAPSSFSKVSTHGSLLIVYMAVQPSHEVDRAMAALDRV